MQTAKSPILWSFTPFRSESISLDVPCDGQKVLVALDGERLEPPLVQMPHSGRLMMGMIPLSVSQPNVVTEAAHFTVLTWADQKVIVIRHQTVREEFYLESFQRLIKNLLKRFVVRILFKDGRTKVRPVEYVITMPSGVSTFRSSHVTHSSKENEVSKTQLKRQTPPGQQKRYRTPLFSEDPIHFIHFGIGIPAECRELGVEHQLTHTRQMLEISE